MSSSIKINNQTVIKVFEAIEGDKMRYSALWELISGKKIDWEKQKKDQEIAKEKIKIVGNLEFTNLKKVESPKLLGELDERINRGEIILNVFNCCQLNNYFNFSWKTMEKTDHENSSESKYGDHCFSAIGTFTLMILILLKKEGKLCTRCDEHLNRSTDEKQPTEKLQKKEKLNPEDTKKKKELKEKRKENI